MDLNFHFIRNSFESSTGFSVILSYFCSLFWTHLTIYSLLIIMWNLWRAGLKFYNSFIFYSNKSDHVWFNTVHLHQAHAFLLHAGMSFLSRPGPAWVEASGLQDPVYELTDEGVNSRTFLLRTAHPERRHACLHPAVSFFTHQRTSRVTLAQSNTLLHTLYTLC